MLQLVETATKSGTSLFQGTHGLHGGPPRNIVSWIEAETLPETTTNPSDKQGLLCVCKRCVGCQDCWCHRPDNACCYSPRCSVCPWFMWLCCRPCCVCVTPNEHRRYRQHLDYLDYLEKNKKKKDNEEPKLLSKWIKMTPSPCEKQLYIAFILAIVLVAPAWPYLYFMICGALPFLSTLSLLQFDQEASWLVLYIVIWALLILHIVFTLAFVMTHYHSCFCLASLCGLCYKGKSQGDDYMWISKEFLKEEKKKVAPDGQTPQLNLDKYKEKKESYGKVWRDKETREIIAMTTNGAIVLDQKLGGYLLDLTNLPNFSNFKVCQCDGQNDPQNRLQVL